MGNLVILKNNTFLLEKIKNERQYEFHSLDIIKTYFLFKLIYQLNLKSGSLILIFLRNLDVSTVEQETQLIGTVFVSPSEFYCSTKT